MNHVYIYYTMQCSGTTSCTIQYGWGWHRLHIEYFLLGPKPPFHIFHMGIPGWNFIQSVHLHLSSLQSLLQSVLVYLWSVCMASVCSALFALLAMTGDPVVALHMPFFLVIEGALTVTSLETKLWQHCLLLLTLNAISILWWTAHSLTVTPYLKILSC